MKGKFYIGVIFILIGIGLLFQQLGLWYFGDIISIWWPLILIGVGVSKLNKRPVSKSIGIIFIVSGALFQMQELNIITVSLVNFFWPLVAIAIGVSMLLPRNLKKDNYEFGKKEVDQDVVDNLALFSGVKSRNVSKSFRGGRLMAVFGGIEMDLSDAYLLNEGASIDVTATFGGVTIMVPPEWKVVVKGIPIFGAWSNKTRGKNYVDLDAPVLTLNCFVAFGGVEIKNYDRYN